MWLSHDYTHILCHNNCTFSSSKYTMYIIVYIKVSPHLDCYSVSATNISIKDFAVGSTVVIPTALFPHPDRNSRLNFKRLYLFSDQQGSRSIHVRLNQSYWKMCISHMLLLRKRRTDLKAFLYIFPEKVGAYLSKNVYHVPMSTFLDPRSSAWSGL